VSKGTGKNRTKTRGPQVDDTCVVCGRAVKLHVASWRSMVSSQGRVVTAPLCPSVSCKLAAKRDEDGVAAAIYRRQKGVAGATIAKPSGARPCRATS
jgi:hypothetical protein